MAPWAARRDAMIAECAAHPGCSRLVEEPSARYSSNPDAMLPAIPRPLVTIPGSWPCSRAAAAVAPNTPQTEVGWNPRAWNASPTTIPRRVTISLPATAATTKSAPEALWACACASAAATTATLMWAIDPVCVSS